MKIRSLLCLMGIYTPLLPLTIINTIGVLIVVKMSIKGGLSNIETTLMFSFLVIMLISGAWTIRNLEEKRTLKLAELKNE